MTVLILGGTAEARELASLLDDRGARVVSSLAGRVSAPRLPPGEVRIGGFGGASGLASYLVKRDITTVIDATHPFAARITASAVSACATTGIPLLVLRRKGWVAGDGDNWHAVSDLEGAASRIGELTGPEGRVLLTTGRQGASAFAGLPQRFWLRAVENPDPPLPARCETILSRGPFTLDDETHLLQGNLIDLLVTKNSGGEMTVAKLTASRLLSIPVVMIDRPPLPAGVTVRPDATSALAWLENAGAPGRSER